MVTPQSTSLSLALFQQTQKVWRVLPKPLRYKIWEVLGPGVQSAYAHQMLARPTRNRQTDPGAPLVIAGLFSTANGIGEAARSTYRALKAAGLEPIAVDLSAELAPVDLAPDIPCRAMPDAGEGTLILQLNGPETVAAMHHLGLKRGRRWYTIGYWAWELPSFPPGWQKAFPFLSELWTISTFTKAALETRKGHPPIHVFPHAISPPSNLRKSRRQFGWSPDTFVFLAMADSMSSFERKNPFAVIEAFKAAFGSDSKRLLVIKTRNLERSPEARADLESMIGDAPNITLLDASLSETKRWQLLKSADAFVSLHRSEGFGLVIAEAMAVGTPVICTGWSGNTDFTDEETALLVEHRLVPCADKYGVYSGLETHWAEVDQASVLEQMRKLTDDPSCARKISVNAKHHIQSWAGAERIGELMAERLEQAAAQSPSKGEKAVTK